jgi:hypothetical protein
LAPIPLSEYSSSAQYIISINSNKSRTTKEGLAPENIECFATMVVDGGLGRRREKA